MKVYVDTWIYVTEKFGNMGFIEVYRGILRYETGIYPTIPNFIYSHFSFISNGFLNWGDGVYTIFTPFMRTAFQTVVQPWLENRPSRVHNDPW